MARVTILLGKGGTGRTTIARALALAKARKLATALLHTSASSRIPDETVSNLSTRVLDPYQIIEDAMVRLIPLGPLTRAFVRHPAYRSFLEIAPGLKEAAVLNFLYGFLDWRDDDVVLDGPATGHGLHFLEAPAKLERVAQGKIAERLGHVDAMLHDPETVEIVLVALPEELPAVETFELAQALRDEGFPVAGLVINKMPPPVPFEVGQAPTHPIEPPSAVPGRDRPGRGHSPGLGAIRAEHALSLMAAERRQAERWAEELKGTGLPTRIVPNLPGRTNLAEEIVPFLEGFPAAEARP